MKMNLLKRMMVYILLPAILGLLSLAFITGRMSLSALETQMNNQLDEIATIQASELNTVFISLGNATEIAGGTVLIKQYVQNIYKNNVAGIIYSSKNASTVINTFLKNLAVSFRYFSDIIILDTNGTIIAHSNPLRVGRNIANYEVFQKSIEGKSSVETRMLASTNGLGIAFGVPIIQDGITMGVVVGLVDLNSIYKELLEGLDFAKTANVYVYDSKGTVVLYSEPEYMGTSEASFEFAHDILKAKSGNIDYTWRNIRSVAFFDTIPSMDWILVVAAEYDDIMEPSRAMTKNIIILSISIILIIGTIIYFVARNVAIAMRNGANLAKHVANGNLKLTSEQTTNMQKAVDRGDEISELTSAMGIMINTLAKMVEESEDKTQLAMTATAAAEEARNIANEATDKAQKARKEGLLDAAAQLEDIVSIIASASEQLTKQIGEVSCGAQIQAYRVNETATVIEEMNNTVLEVARNASKSAELTDTTRQQAIDGE